MRLGCPRRRAASATRPGTPSRCRRRTRARRPGDELVPDEIVLPGRQRGAEGEHGGQREPSFIPDSRLSEWRTSRGTRGLVTTLEDSTGSVGESSAPSRNDSVHVRSVTACVTSATSTHVIGIARTSLRAGSRHSRWSISPSTSIPSRNRITIRATVASCTTKPDSASNSSTPSPPSPSTKPATTNTAVIDRKLRWASPAGERADDQQPAEDERGDLELVASAGQASILRACASTTPLPTPSGSTARVRPRRRRWRASPRPTWRSSAAASPACGRPCRPSRSSPQREVVLLEAETAGWGASGRNGGFVDASLTHGLLERRRALPARARRARGARAGEPRGHQGGPGAPPDRRGAGRRPACCRSPRSRTSWPSSTRRSALLRRYGWEAEVLDRDAVRAAVASPTYLGAVLQRTGVALVDPGALALGLRRAALALGVRLYERTPVLRRRSCARPAGSVRAERVLLATGAYPPLTRAIRRLVAPVYDYVLVTEPLTAAQRARDRLGARARASPTAATASTTTASRPTGGSCSAATRPSTASATASTTARLSRYPPIARLLVSTCWRRSRRSRGSASRTPGAARSTPAAASA